jgi:anti-sigma B factor antagonist
MAVSLATAGAVTVAALTGELDASTAPAVQQQLLPLAQPGARVVLDLTAVPYMSSAGLRLLLSIYRQISANSGAIALAGVADEIKDTMGVTGFLKFFAVHDSVEAAVASLEG